jgi:hypothetical protein
MRVPLPAAMTRTESGEAVVIMMSSLQNRSWLKARWIIGVALALLLAGCSVLRIAYSQASTVAYWWIDGRVDLDAEQSARLRDEAQRRLDAGLNEATPVLAALMLSLTPEQIRHLERKLAQDGEKLRDDFAQPDPAERARAAFKRTLERYENLYGKLDESQRARLTQLLAGSPFDADRWLAERERRNRDLVDMLRTVSTAGRDADPAKAQAQAQAAVRVLAERTLRSPRPEYRAYQERLTQANCALAATMHNATTPAQRQYARNKLKGWEDDVRLIVAGNNAPVDANGNVSTR